MTELSANVQEARDQVYEADSLLDAISTFQETFAKSSQDRKERIADDLINDFTQEEQPPKKLHRLIAMLAALDTPAAAEFVTTYAYGDSKEPNDRVQARSLVSLTGMTCFDGMCDLLQRVLEDEGTGNRIKALALRLSIQCNASDLTAGDD